MERYPIETIIYGGAFNPPTLAHQAILQSCIDYAEPRGAEVWLLPSASRKDKSINVAHEHRIWLCDALVKDVVSHKVTVTVSTIELDREAATETYETVQSVYATYPDRHFTWVFGSDSVADMPSWNHGEWLKSMLRMLVVHRPGSPNVQLGSNATWLTVETPVISSTEVRRRIAAGEEYSQLVGDHVGNALAQGMHSSVR